MARTAKNTETPATETDAPALDLEVGTDTAPESTEGAPESAAEGTEQSAAPEPVVEAGSIDMGALIAQASARDTSYGESRSKKVRGADGKPVYGVFETPDGHIVAINRDALGRETDWSLFRLLPGGKLAHVGNFRRKVDALDYLDAQRLAVVAEVTADPELDAAVAAAGAEVAAEESVTA